MSRPHSTSIILFTLLLHVIFTARLIDAGKGRSVRVPANLDDVVDNEEDEEWKEWGRKKIEHEEDDEEEEGPNPDFNKMDHDQIKGEMFKRMKGPVIGFVKLRLDGGEERTKESVSEIAWRWTSFLKTGGTNPNFMGIDLDTIMFTLPKSHNVEELRDVLLDQPDAYEVKIGDHVFRRPGDPPIEDVMMELERNRNDKLKDQ